MRDESTFRVKTGLAEMLKGGVIMDVVTPAEAEIAEKAGAAAVMALERVPSDIRRDGGVARMSDPQMIKGIQEAVSIPVMAKARIGHFVEAQVLEALEVDYIDESEVLTPADEANHIDRWAFKAPFVCGATNLGEALRRRVKQSDPEALIIGEVWENAVQKISYGARRRFLLGRQCDSVMNYPWREAIIQLIRTGNVSAFAESVQTLCEDYPPPVLDVLMNVLSTHDSVRIITALGCEQEVPNEEKGTFRLSEAALDTARFRLRLAAVLQFTLPGIPSIYYGDEIGMQGFADPYNRAFYDEAHADGALRAFYGKLGEIRKEHRDDFGKRIEFCQASEGVLHYRRGNVGIWMCFGVPHAAPSQKSLLDVFDSSGRRVAVIYEQIGKN